MENFKHICRNRNFYMAQVYCIEEELKQIDILMSKPRSPQLEVIGQPAHDHQSHIVDWINRKVYLEKERDRLLELISRVDEIKNLKNPWREIFWKVLVVGQPVRTICKEYGVSKDSYYRRINTAFNRERKGD